MWWWDGRCVDWIYYLERSAYSAYYEVVEAMKIRFHSQGCRGRVESLLVVV
jgi:hypothetical protein